MKKFTLLFFAIIFSTFIFAQERPKHEIYSMMMYNFTRYVQWPNENGTEFIIGVVGNNEIYRTLTNWYTGKTKGGQTFVIKSFRNASDLTDCAVIYIDKSKSNEFDAIKTKLMGKGTLIITDKTGLGARGSGINFTTIDNKLKFELNQKAIENSNLKVAGSLVSMAIII